MSPERELIHRVEAADALQLAQIIAGASAQEERVLRTHLGEERFRRMRERVVRASLTRRKRAPRGNVVVIHGIMGAELSAHQPGDDDVVWVHIPRILMGRLSRLRLAADGLTEATPGWTVRASGILKKYYGDLLLYLADNWHVKPFFFDWRKNLDLAAHELNDRIVQWFGNQPVHIVAHSMGGLVARTFIANHADAWRRMWDERGGGARGGRLVMLGTPNHGSFAITQVIAGLEPIVQKLSLVDLKHDLDELQQIFNTFPGSLHMLPSPLKYDSLRPLYEAATYRPLEISQTHLTAALNHHLKLSKVIDRDRMIYVAGYNQPTLQYVDPKLSAISNPKAYAVTREGDGRVPHYLGLLDKVPTYYTETDHGALSEEESVFRIVQDLLDSGKSDAPAKMPLLAKSKRGDSDAKMRAAIQQQTDADMAEIASLTPRRAARASAAQTGPTDDDRRIEELALRGMLGGGKGLTRGTKPTTFAVRAAAGEPRAETRAQVTVRLVLGSIADAHTLGVDSQPVDAIAVGHYIGVPPLAAEKVIDGILTDLESTRARAQSNGRPRKGIVAEFTERGILRGALGEPFFIHDPRARGKNGTRLFTFIGLGEPGRLGVPELTVAVRELCWSLGRLGKRHLASVLIGAGPGNLAIPDAVGAWMRGVRRALIDGRGTGQARRSLARITLVEWDAARISTIAEALKMEKVRQRDAGLEIQLVLPDGRKPAKKVKKPRGKKRNDRTDANGAADPTPTVVTVSRDKDGYVFSALTERASVPERTVAVDNALVLEANERLAGSADPDGQRTLGRTLMDLVVPSDLRAHLRSAAPVVMVVDATTARLHWEMMADGEQDAETADTFLATGRGLTRRLRTSFAPPPEPPPPAARTLRVLVVADPAGDARLEGAAREGMEVARLFERFNRVHGSSEHQVEVTTLFGPEEATRLNVLIALTQSRFDVLHFAGHCTFDPDDIANSGWIFTGDARLTARELNRIDRIPPFIFSNACESGITPERASARTVAAAPSFAEAFFARGVSNFICTAWEVDDEAALKFATNLYTQLLGLQSGAQGSGRFTTMAEALRIARSSIFKNGGLQTWGAYHHYGTPSYRFFEAGTEGAGTHRSGSIRTDQITL